MKVSTGSLATTAIKCLLAVAQDPLAPEAEVPSSGAQEPQALVQSQGQDHQDEEAVKREDTYEEEEAPQEKETEEEEEADFGGDDDAEEPEPEQTAIVPPCPQIRGIVKGSDHMVIYSATLASDALEALLLHRNNELIALSLEPTQGTLLPFQSQKNAS